MVKVTIKVASNSKDLFVVGSTKNLGAWNASKAEQLEKCEKCGKFSVSKMFNEGEVVEFKVLAGKSWDAVEKGQNQEEVQNHQFVASKGLVVELEVNNFAN